MNRDDNKIKSIILVWSRKKKFCIPKIITFPEISNMDENIENNISMIIPFNIISCKKESVVCNR